MAMEIRVEGAEELQRALTGIPFVMRRFIEGPGVAAAASVMARELRRIVPVVEGNLKKSISRIRIPDYDLGREIPRGKAIVVMGGPGARHAHLVELGTIKMPAQHLMRRATQATRDKQHKAYVNSAIKNFVKISQQIEKGDITRQLGRIIDA